MSSGVCIRLRLHLGCQGRNFLLLLVVQELRQERIMKRELLLHAYRHAQTLSKYNPSKLTKFHVNPEYETPSRVSVGLTTVSKRLDKALDRSQNIDCLFVVEATAKLSHVSERFRQFVVWSLVAG